MDKAQKCIDEKSNREGDFTPTKYMKIKKFFQFNPQARIV